MQLGYCECDCKCLRKEETRTRELEVLCTLFKLISCNTRSVKGEQNGFLFWLFKLLFFSVVCNLCKIPPREIWKLLFSVVITISNYENDTVMILMQLLNIKLRVVFFSSHNRIIYFSTVEMTLFFPPFWNSNSNYVHKPHIKNIQCQHVFSCWTWPP